MDKKKILCVKRKTGRFLLISSLLIVLCISAAGFAGCGKQEEHTHAFTEQNVKQIYLAEEATCTQAAKYYYSCTCGEKGTETFEIGNALGHNFGEWVTVTPATEEKDGLEERTCARCEEKEEKTIPATKHTHNYVETVISPTCTTGGYTLHKCKCGEQYEDSYVSALNHSFTNYVPDGNATCTQDGTKTAKCDRCDETDTIADEKTALGHNFGEWVTVTPATEEKDGLEERTCTRCEEKEEKTIPAVKHTHVFDKKVAEEKYLAAPATCTAKATYYYSCACGERGTETFTSGSPNGHTYSTEWTYNATEHWHAATCGHATEKDRAKHNFGNGKKCAVCNYTTAKPIGLELQSPVFNIDMANKTAYLKVANAVTDYDFRDKFTVAEGARFDVCTDKECNNKIASKRTDLVAGDNVFYILVTNGNDVASYTVTLRRRPIYTVTFNTNGGTAINKQQVEEDGIATEPATERKGYDFIEWDYDFSTPIIKDEAITASWNIITYKISYELNGGENTENNPTTYTVEDNIKLSVPTKTGYTGSWNNGGKIEKGSAGDITFTASWLADVKLSSDGSTVIGLRDFSVKNLVILSEYNGTEVVSISSSAFEGCSSLLSVTIPDSVTSIGNSAFKGCNSLLNVIWNAENCTEAGSSDYSIFRNCSKLSSVTFGENVKSIPSYAFRNCSGLTRVTIGNGVTSIGACAFYGCSGVTGDLVIPDSVTSIGNYAFDGCSGLTSVTIPDSVTSIGDYAFSGCSSITNIYYKGDIAAWCKISGLGTLMSYGTSNKNLYIGGTLLTGDLVIPDSVTSIGACAFYGCSGLTRVTIGNGVTSIGSYAFSGCSGLTSIVIPDSVTSIGSAAFYDCSGLTSVTIPDSVTSIGDYAFSGCSSITNIYYKGDIAAWCKISGLGTLMSYGTSNKNLYIGGTLLTGDLVIPDSVTSIGSSAFYYCSGLTSVTIPDSVTSIGDYAFSGCSSITNIYYKGDIAAWCKISGLGALMSYGTSNKNLYIGGTLLTGDLVIPDSVTSIGSGAFWGCSGFTSVTIPDSVTYIGSYAFYKCNSITSITIPFVGASKAAQGYDQVFGYIFGYSTSDKYYAIHQYDDQYDRSYYYYIPSSLKTVVISDGSTTIPYNAFKGCSSLTSITIPDSVTYIGNSAFYNCSSLTSVTIPDSVTYIGSYAFYKCNSITSVTISDSVTYIGKAAFYECSRLTGVTIPDNVTSIGSSAFYGCRSLISATIGNRVMSIGSSAFGWCANLTSVIWNAENCTEVGASDSPIFEYCGKLSSVTFGESVKSISSPAFYGCSGLISVTIGNSVTYIDEYAFYGCNSLQTVYYKGGKSEWSKIGFMLYIGRNNYLTSAERYYYSETKPTESGNYWHYNAEGGVEEW